MITLTVSTEMKSTHSELSSSTLVGSPARCERDKGG